MREYLEGKITYTLHKPRRVNFPRRPTIPAGYMTNLQADLADFQSLEADNNHNRFLLVGIDVLSRHIFAAATKSKSSKDMQAAFDVLFEKMPMLRTKQCRFRCP